MDVATHHVPSNAHVGLEQVASLSDQHLHNTTFVLLMKFMQKKLFGVSFGHVGRATSLDVIVQLFKVKCLPALYYGSEVCPVNRTVTMSLQYVIKGCFSKIFQTRSDDVIAECMNMFNCLPVTDAISSRKRNFLSRFRQCDNFLCHLCCFAASIEF